eukprot:351840-Chlamydomonas_euryale.AAC.6
MSNKRSYDVKQEVVWVLSLSGKLWSLKPRGQRRFRTMELGLRGELRCCGIDCGGGVVGRTMVLEVWGGLRWWGGGADCGVKAEGWTSLLGL